MVTGIARKHIPPDYLVKDDTIDEAAHHGGEVAHAHYRIVEGDLPYLSADLVWRHRAVSEEWHNVLGVGKHRPSRPLQIIASDPHPSTLAKDHYVLFLLKCLIQAFQAFPRLKNAS